MITPASNDRERHILGARMTKIASNDQIAELEKLSRATSGPWRIYVEGEFDGQDWQVGFSLGEAEIDGKYQHVVISTDYVSASELRGAALDDAELIVAMRNLVPALIARVREEEAIAKARGDMVESIEAENARLREALESIAEGRGRFSRDQLEFATNVIDEAKATARAALASESERT